ncbi:hypothetical protein F5Y16DRAFT_404447 [Xylariaceae sp. FL0255]|nr:hypothetical protein F5Y16DRAFT_404447 [Xylariaceae sp. FL0255]
MGGGQRFNVLLTTKSQKQLDTGGQYDFWIQYASRGRLPDLSGFALLQYSTGSSSKRQMPQRSSLPGDFPKTSPVHLPADSQLNDWLEYTLEALNPQGEFPTLDKVTCTVYITVKEEVINGSVIRGKTFYIVTMIYQKRK